jgi:hypothetical protein
MKCASHLQPFTNTQKSEKLYLYSESFNDTVSATETMNDILVKCKVVPVHTMKVYGEQTYSSTHYQPRH